MTSMVTVARTVREQGSCTFRPTGNSMTPRVRSGQQVTVTRLQDTDDINVRDIVLVTVHGRTYLHQVIGISGERYLIGNNHGRVNGWTTRKHIHGKLAH